MKTFSFDVDDAKRYGTDGAIFLYNLRFWLNVQQDKRHNFKEGKYWAYWSNKQLRRIFSFWTDKQITRIKSNLVKLKAIEISNYNKVAYDRTSWFTLAPNEYDLEHDENGDEIPESEKEEKSECKHCNNAKKGIEIDTSGRPNGQIEIPKRSNRNTQTLEPIPDDLTDDLKDSLTNTGGPPPDVVSNDFIEKETVEVIDYLNAKCAKSYQANKKTSSDFVRNVLRRGNTKADCKLVIDHLARVWSTKRMKQYLRPRTIFNGDFEGRLEDIKANPQKMEDKYDF